LLSIKLSIRVQSINFISLCKNQSSNNIYKSWGFYIIDKKQHQIVNLRSPNVSKNFQEVMGLTYVHPNNKTNKCNIREVTLGVYNPSCVLSLSYRKIKEMQMQGNIRILFAKSKICKEALDCDATTFPIQKIFNSRINL